MKIMQLLKNKKAVPFIGIGLILIVYTMLLFLPMDTDRQPTDDDSLLQPTRVSTDLSFVEQKQKTNPPVSYNSRATQKMLDRIENKVPLSRPDQEAKQRLLASVNGQSSVLQNTADYRIEYINPLGTIMVEIKTTDVGKAKQEVLDWLISRGFTPQGVCELPVVYYLNRQAAEQLRELNITFSPIAEGC